MKKQPNAKPEPVVIAAGVPTEIHQEFVAKFLNTSPIVACPPLDRTKQYSHSYTIDLYERLASKLKERGRSERSDFLKDVNLVLLYIDKNDRSESVLFEEFGAEALLVPMKIQDITTRALKMGNQRREAVNELVSSGKRAIKRAGQLLSVIAEEVTNRKNRTCLLLPRKNFGNDIDRVFACVHHASLKGEGKDEFEKRLKKVAQSLSTVRENRRTYFKSRNGLVFKSPPKAGARHGVAPGWSTGGHKQSCVIRGRIRFGVSYDPQFHYDCVIPKGGNRLLPSCHDLRQVPLNRGYANIAPNDNVRV